MAERLRSIDVEIVVDTNKDTYRHSLSMGEDETRTELADRAMRVIARLDDDEPTYDDLTEENAKLKAALAEALSLVSGCLDACNGATAANGEKMNEQPGYEMTERKLAELRARFLGGGGE